MIPRPSVTPKVCHVQLNQFPSLNANFQTYHILYKASPIVLILVNRVRCGRHVSAIAVKSCDVLGGDWSWREVCEVALHGDFYSADGNSNIGGATMIPIMHVSDFQQRTQTCGKYREESIMT